VLVLLASALGALLSRLHSWIVLPTVVLEIVLGIVIGPEVLDLAEMNSCTTQRSRGGLLDPTSVSTLELAADITQSAIAAPS